MPATRIPTSEQEEVIQTSLEPGQVMIINAIAGSGKTSTLQMYVDRYPEKKFLYLAFGKGQADEAKQRFATNAECRTTHSLAYRETGLPYAKNRAKGLGSEPRSKTVMGPLNITVPSLAQMTIATVSKYLQSAASSIGTPHLPEFAQYKPLDEQLTILQKAKTLWSKMCDKNDVSIPMSHDGYLKLWQLGCLRSGKVPHVFYQYDAILLDEAQDTNPAVEAILGQIIEEKNHAVVLVGDERQSIYQWRGAVNMMSRLSEKIDDAQIDGIKKSLTESFRYGPRAADAASKILSLGCEKKMKILGRGADEPRPSQGSRCYLSRTNATLMNEALSSLTANPHASIHFAGTNAVNRYDPTVPYKLNLIRSLYYYYANERHLATDPTVKRFEDWNEVLRHAKGGDDDPTAECVDKELGAAVRFVEKHGYQTLDVLDLIVSRSGDPNHAIASFSTAHRAKGLEWDHVTVLDDFPKIGSEMERDEHGELQIPDEQELNLLYVAVTRGRKWVDLNEDILEFVEMEFPRHFEESRPSKVLERNKDRVNERAVSISL
jgi:F-box protein, helicase, 18